MHKHNLLYRQPVFVQKLFRLPITMLLVLTFVSIIGFMLMYSAGKGESTTWLSRQLIHFAICFPIMVIVAITDIRFWYRYSYIAYFFTLFLLVLVEISGHTAMGATRWINLGFFKIQPSEIMKICLVFALARYFHSNHDISQRSPLKLILPTLIVILPSLLIIKQPDLGTAIILLVLGTIIFFTAGVKMWIFITAGILAVGSLPVVWPFLHTYQKQRVLTFLNPESDPLGSGYNIIQSKIAIGSGGLFGKGLLNGTQSQLEFLPEHQTDFIFTMALEELGFTGGVFILLLYFVLISYGTFIALNSSNHYGRLLAIGCISIFSLHVFINTAMVLGLIPVVGVPLPLLSYGGTIMMTIFIAFGLILNVHIHRNTYISLSRNHLF